MGLPDRTAEPLGLIDEEVMGPKMPDAANKENKHSLRLLGQRVESSAGWRLYEGVIVGEELFVCFQRDQSIIYSMHKNFHIS